MPDVHAMPRQRLPPPAIGVALRGRPIPRMRGFSLIELAVVLVIIGLLVGGGIAALEVGTERSRRAEQRAQFDAVRAALYGFAMAQGRLPCPDVSDPLDGREDKDTTVSPFECDAAEGALPWADLGVGRRDAWGSPLRYRVTTDATAEPDFADAVASGPATFAIGDQGSVSVSDAAGGGSEVAGSVVAIVVSYGRQGDRLWINDDATLNCPAPGSQGISAEEAENCNTDGAGEFADPGYRPPDVDDGFDDMMTWIPYPVLTARMVDAGVLP